jgi:hypothetical protein
LTPLSLRALRLTVTDRASASATSPTRVTVRDTTAPEVTAPQPISVPVTEANGVRAANWPALAAWLQAATATDRAGETTALGARLGSSEALTTTLLPVGTSVVTFAFSDAKGNVGSGTSTVTVSYEICLLHDPSVAKESGSTYPIKVRLCDASGRNLSSPSIVLRLVSLTRTGTNAPAALDHSGKGNADVEFRYDASLRGYILNLKTKGLAPGTYNLNFTAGTDPKVHSVAFAIKRRRPLGSSGDAS